MQQIKKRYWDDKSKQIDATNFFVDMHWLVDPITLKSIRWKKKLNKN